MKKSEILYNFNEFCKDLNIEKNAESVEKYIDIYTTDVLTREIENNGKDIKEIKKEIKEMLENV